MNGEPSELRYLERTKSLTSSLKKSYYNRGNVTNNTYCKYGFDTSCSNCSKGPNWGKSRTFFHIFEHISHVRFANESFMWLGSFTVIQSNPVITFGFDKTRRECWGLGYKLKSYFINAIIYSLLHVLVMFVISVMFAVLSPSAGHGLHLCVRRTKIVDKYMGIVFFYFFLYENYMQPEY